MNSWDRTNGIVVPGAYGQATMGQERVQYLRKVYGLLTLSAALAIACGYGAITLGGTVPLRLSGAHHVAVPAVVAAMMSNPLFLYGSWGVLFVATLGASYVSRVPVLNVLALFFVSALMGLQIAPMIFVAQIMAGLGQTLTANPVRDTFLMVGSLFVGLTSYVAVSKKDFSFLRATLSMGFWVVMAGCLLSFVFQTEAFSLAIASVGALLSAGFLLYQTSYIFKNSAMDNPVGDALGLIVQVRNLFMFILRILMSSRR
jgi:modulator of FtsH protease